VSTRKLPRAGETLQSSCGTARNPEDLVQDNLHDACTNRLLDLSVLWLQRKLEACGDPRKRQRLYSLSSDFAALHRTKSSLLVEPVVEVVVGCTPATTGSFNDTSPPLSECTVYRSKKQKENEKGRLCLELLGTYYTGRSEVTFPSSWLEQLSPCRSWTLSNVFSFRVV
jgi:hypothetical protein